MKMSSVSFNGLPSLNQAENLWDVLEQGIFNMTVQLKTVLKGCDAIMSQKKVSNISWNPCHQELKLF